MKKHDFQASNLEIKLIQNESVCGQKIDMYLIRLLAILFHIKWNICILYKNRNLSTQFQLL